MPSARLDKVSLSFGLKPLLDNASLLIRKGERVCLLGRNGEGKSSLLRLLTRALVPDSGEVWVRPGAWNWTAMRRSAPCPAVGADG